MIALVLATGAITSCSRAEQAAPRAYTVSITNFTFSPSDLSLARGDTVVWTNTDFVPHTATARDTSWDSGSMAANATWRFVADAPGAHEYYCVLHPGMRGTITVRQDRGQSR